MRLFFYILVMQFSFLISSPLFAGENFDKPMEFELAGSGGNMAGSEWISAIGVITPDTPKKFEQFIKSNSYQFTVYLHSPGGNLLAGLELGRLFRKHGVNTSIGETIESDGWNDTGEGVCASSCAYAFMGGIVRTVDEKNIYALHQFYNMNAQIGYAGSVDVEGQRLSVEQLNSGMIAAYLSEMGIDSKALELASWAGKDGVYSLNKSELSALNITTEYNWSPWRLEADSEKLVMQRTNNDPLDPIKAEEIGCSDFGNLRIRVTTIPISGSWGSENKLYFEPSDTENAELISEDNLFLRSDSSALVLDIKLTQKQSADVYKNRQYSINFDTARAVFGTWIASGSKFDDDDWKKLSLVFANCKPSKSYTREAK